MAGMHKELRIVRGIVNAPGDTGSAETGYTIIDLLAGAAEGFALNSDAGGWDPALPAPKSGLWNDVPFVDGRVPYAGAEENVTETLDITITASSHLRMSQLLAQLFDLIEDCKSFWFDEFDCQPVFLWWWATGAPGRQFALIMTIDANVSNPGTDDVGNIVRDVVLTIEREPFWRAEVPPGGNPILWTLFAQNKQPGLDYDYLADLRIIQTNTLPILYALAQATIRNKVEYTLLTASANTPSMENRLTIPASSIPGDAPALLQLALSHTLPTNQLTGETFVYMVARSTRARTRTARDGFQLAYRTLFPFTAGQYGGPAVQADGGGVGGYNVTTATTIAASRLAITPGVFGSVWSATTGVDKNIQRGRFAVFVRCRQNSGALGEIEMRVSFSYNNSVVSGAKVSTNTVIAPLQAGTGTTTYWPVAYMGSVRLPIDRDETLSTLGAVGGSGRFNATLDNLAVMLECGRVSGTSLLYFLDVILMPYDEDLLDTTLITPSSEFTEAVLIDNTGYLARGKPDQLAVAIRNRNVGSAEMDARQEAIEENGSALTLEPGVDNHLYIFERSQLVGSNQASDSNAISTIVVSANIVPRWRGIRSV